MKKILIFSLAYYPRFVGGAEVAIKEITDRTKDIEFHLICLRFDSRLPKEEKIGNVCVHRVGFGRPGATPNASYGLMWFIDKMLFVPLAALKAYGLNRTRRFDALWAMMTYMLFPVVLLRTVGVRPPYILTLQEGDPFGYVFNRPVMRPLRPLLRYGFRHAKVIQVISTYLRGWAKLLHYRGTVEVIPNGVTGAAFASTVPQETLHAVKERIGKKEGEVWLIHTGRLTYKNGLDNIVEALVLLPPHVHFFQIGDGPTLPALVRLVEKKGLERRVHLHPYVKNEELPLYLQACDIFVRPSRSEGMGNSFIEAMAAGLPVIGTQEGGIADFLFDAKRNPQKPTTGFAVDVNSPVQIAERVEEIIKNPEAVRAVVHTARTLALGSYDWNLLAKNMQKRVFTKVLA